MGPAPARAHFPVDLLQDASAHAIRGGGRPNLHAVAAIGREIAEEDYHFWIMATLARVYISPGIKRDIPLGAVHPQCISIWFGGIASYSSIKGVQSSN